MTFESVPFAREYREVVEEGAHDPFRSARPACEHARVTRMLDVFWFFRGSAGP
jgi:hypothetical protein